MLTEWQSIDHFPLSLQILAVIIGLIAGGFGHVWCWRRASSHLSGGRDWRGFGYLFGGIGCGAGGTVPLLALLSAT